VKPIYLIILLITIVIGHVQPSYAQDCQAAPQKNQINDQPSIDITQYKEQYEGKTFNPTPNYIFIINIIIFSFLLFLASIMVRRGTATKALTIITIISLIYFGIIRGGCICPVGSISNITMGIIHPILVGTNTVLIFIIPLFMALFRGRIFCTSICPLGAVQHILTKKNNNKKLIPKKINKLLTIIPILVLLVTIITAVKYTNETYIPTENTLEQENLMLEQEISDEQFIELDEKKQHTHTTVRSPAFIACHIDPYKQIFHSGQIWYKQLINPNKYTSLKKQIIIIGSTVTWIYLLIILIIGYWIPRPFCRFLCPYGVILGLISLLAIQKRRIDKATCLYCGKCQKICPTQAITINKETKTATISSYACIQCNQCQDACPKKSIIMKKAE